MVASLTALSVLMCGILCACPGAAEASADTGGKAPSHQSHGEEAGHGHEHSKKSFGHCHGSEPAVPEQEKAPEEPCGDHEGQPCSHCERPLISKLDSKSAELAPHYHLVHFFLPLFQSTTQPQVTSYRPEAVSGAPPPAEWSTLLRLHCALII